MIRYHFGYDQHGRSRPGKRLRPQLLLRTALEEGGNVEDALDAAISIEILHNYSLVHDDIEDGDRLRHGQTTIWAQFGIPHGINVGDGLCSLSYLTILHGTVSSDRLVETQRLGLIPNLLLDASAERLDRREVVEPSVPVSQRLLVLHEANLQMCEGQGIDITFESLPSVTMDQYLEMISGKTGALFSASCQLGAIAAGCAPERAKAYARLGRTYGRAFQIRDDVLGAWGATDLTGKPSGADLARRKWSFPVVWALETPPSADREVVAAAYARGSRLDEHDVEKVSAALDRLGARAAADEAHDRALAEADALAREASIDRGGTIRDFLALGARRVA